MAMLGKLIGRSLGDDEGLEVNELLKDARETTDWAAKAREGFSPITKGDKEIQRFFRPRSPTNQEGREYWPGVPFAKLGVKLQCAKLQHERFHIDQVKEGQKPDQDDLFPNRHRVNEEWDDWAMELAWDQTGKKKKKAKKRYSFSKADVEALEAEAKGDHVLTWDDLNQFMSRKLLVGDIIEATKEIVYPNEGLVIPIGRKARVVKDKLDGRETQAAVFWDFTEGIRAVDTRSRYFMKKPIEVVLAFGSSPNEIQFPAASHLKPGVDLVATWRHRDDATYVADATEAVRGGGLGDPITGAQHLDAQTVLLRQGFNEKAFALESAKQPHMMISVVESALVGQGGIRDKRRLRLVDYSERQLDEQCCFKPKLISERKIRLECCAERSLFVMLRLTSEPKVSPPFMHCHVFSTDKKFKTFTTFTLLKTKKELPEYIKDEYNVVKRNPMLMQKEGRLGGFVAADRVKEVKAEIAGQNAVAVTWTPNVGAVRIWCQYKAPAVLSNGGEYLALMRDWLENEAAAGGKKFNIGVGATSELVDQIEKNMKNSGAFLGLPGKKLRAMRTKSSTGAVNRIMMETMNWGGCNNERPDEKEPTKAERIAMLLGKSQKTKVDPNSEAAKKKGLEFLSEWVLAATKTSGMSAPRVAIVSTAWANGHEEANGINQVRICVAPLHRQHRFADIKKNDFYLCGAACSPWFNLPPSEVWEGVQKKKKEKSYNLEDDSESEEEEEVPPPPVADNKPGSSQMLLQKAVGGVGAAAALTSTGGALAGGTGGAAAAALGGAPLSAAGGGAAGGADAAAKPGRSESQRSLGGTEHALAALMGGETSPTSGPTSAAPSARGAASEPSKSSRGRSTEDLVGGTTGAAAMSSDGFGGPGITMTVTDAKGTVTDAKVPKADVFGKDGKGG